MVSDKKTGIKLLSIVGFLWAVMSPICLGLGLFFVAFYDSPINPQAGMGFLDHTLIWSILSFPILCAISSLGIWFFNKRSKGAATFVALLPIVPLILIFAIFSWSSSGTTKKQVDIIQVSDCISPVFDSGDGLKTTGCGSLQIGMSGSGTLSTTTEAHNWQFSAEAGQVRITVKNDGNSCPHIVVLDASGTIVDGFDDENNLRLCPNGMITTGFFEFTAPETGAYTLRLFSPETSGAYWVSIE